MGTTYIRQLRDMLDNLDGDTYSPRICYRNNQFHVEYSGDFAETTKFLMENVGFFIKELDEALLPTAPDSVIASMEFEKGFEHGRNQALADFHAATVEQEKVRHSMQKRIDELLEANTEYLNRARAAEAHAANIGADMIEGVAFNMTGMACDRIGGSYGFPGIVVAHFKTLAGNERVVVECVVPEVAGMLHIYSPKQIENTNADDFRRISLLDLMADSARLQKDPGGGDRIDDLGED